MGRGRRSWLAFACHSVLPCLPILAETERYVTKISDILREPIFCDRVTSLQQIENTTDSFPTGIRAGHNAQFSDFAFREHGWQIATINAAVEQIVPTAASDDAGVTAPHWKYP